jgi:hypothetical protein
MRDEMRPKRAGGPFRFSKEPGGSKRVVHGRPELVAGVHEGQILAGRYRAECVPGVGDKGAVTDFVLRAGDDIAEAHALGIVRGRFRSSARRCGTSPVPVETVPARRHGEYKGSP